MSTRGSIGFHCKGESKLTYNHFDSYPSGLGSSFVEECKKIVKKYTPDEMERVFNQIELIDDRDYDVSLLTILEKKSMYDATSFIKDSLFCEWAYVFNIDDWAIEIYKGFQKTYQKNRYAIETPSTSGYYSCALIEKIPLENIDNILSLNESEDGLIVEYDHEYEYLRNSENATLMDYFNINADLLTEAKRLQLVDALSEMMNDIDLIEENEEYGFFKNIINGFLNKLK